MDTALAWEAGDLDQVIVAGEAALALQAGIGTDSVDDDARAITLANVGAAAMWAGHLDDAEPRLREGTAVATRAGPATVGSSASASSGCCARRRRGPPVGRERVEGRRRAWLIVIDAGGRRPSGPGVGPLLRRRSGRGQPPPGRGGGHVGTGCWPMALAVAILRGRLQRARGDLTGALGTVAMARRGLAGRRPPTALWRWLLLTGRSSAPAWGNPSRRRALLENLDGSGPPLDGEAVALARLRLAEGDAAGAPRPSPCLDGAVPSGFLMVPAEAWLADAWPATRSPTATGRRRRWSSALGLAEQKGFAMRSFLDAGAAASRCSPGTASGSRPSGRTSTSWCRRPPSRRR